MISSMNLVWEITTIKKLWTTAYNAMRIYVSYAQNITKKVGIH